jgi:hypothetical protein
MPEIVATLDRSASASPETPLEIDPEPAACAVPAADPAAVWVRCVTAVAEAPSVAEAVPDACPVTRVVELAESCPGAVPSAVVVAMYSTTAQMDDRRTSVVELVPGFAPICMVSMVAAVHGCEFWGLTAALSGVGRVDDGDVDESILVHHVDVEMSADQSDSRIVPPVSPLIMEMRVRSAVAVLDVAPARYHTSTVVIVSLELIPADDELATV